MSTKVFLNPDEMFDFRQRNLFEHSLTDKLTDSEFDSFLQYLRNESNNKSRFCPVYPNPSIFNVITKETAPIYKLEALFWIPPTEAIVLECYKDAPKFIVSTILAMQKYHDQNSSQDFGFVLIGFF